MGPRPPKTEPGASRQRSLSPAGPLEARLTADHARSRRTAHGYYWKADGRATSIRACDQTRRHWRRTSHGTLTETGNDLVERLLTVHETGRFRRGLAVFACSRSFQRRIWAS